MIPMKARGSWWIPGDRRQRKATGVLSYEPIEGSVLDVFGKRLNAESVYIPIIHGETESGPATLLDCIVEHSRSRNLSENYSQLLACGSVILGAHVKTNTLFKSAILRVKHLDDWARMGSIETLSPVRQHLSDAELGFYYKKEQPFTARLPDGSWISLGAETKGHFAAHETSLAREHTVTISLDRGKSLDVLVNEYVKPVVDLVTLMVDQPSVILDLQVASRRRFGNTGFVPPDYCDVGLRLGAGVATEGASSSPGTQIISRAEFDFEQGILSWFGLASKLRGIRSLAFGLRYAPSMYVENRLLNATMAAEGLHRATFVPTRAGIDLSNQATKNWIAQYPESERNLIKARLNQYINDPSLKDRLEALAEKAGEAFAALVPEPSKWIKLVKDIRNDLTHQEGAPKTRLSSTRISALADSVALLVYICLLIDIGYRADDLKDKLLRSFRVRILQAELRAMFPPVV